ncbi:MAG: hypothetical protein AABZ57_02685 [Candidatus Margulisiibacteriota bacterium]
MSPVDQVVSCGNPYANNVSGLSKSDQNKLKLLNEALQETNTIMKKWGDLSKDNGENACFNKGKLQQEINEREHWETRMYTNWRSDVKKGEYIVLTLDKTLSLLGYKRRGKLDNLMKEDLYKNNKIDVLFESVFDDRIIQFQIDKRLIACRPKSTNIGNKTIGKMRESLEDKIKELLPGKNQRRKV